MKLTHSGLRHWSTPYYVKSKAIIKIAKSPVRNGQFVLCIGVAVLNLSIYYRLIASFAMVSLF